MANNISFYNFKKRILKNIDEVDIAFEVGYCYKAITENECWMKKQDLNYWKNCYIWLKGLADYYGVECWR